MKVIELFGGIGACTQALKRLGVETEVVDYVEIDKYAVKSYNAINGTEFEPQDITQWDKDVKADFIMHGSPCTDFSIAGQQLGASERGSTRSSLMYETIRIVEKIKPQYVVWENVKNVLSQKHKHNFDNYLNKMKELGYNNYYQILNAKDYGVPQNRERIFVISCKNNIDYKFPEKMESRTPMRELLEPIVGDKFYLSADKVDRLVKQVEEKKGLQVLINQATKAGYIPYNDGGNRNSSYPDSKTRRGRVQEDGEVVCAPNVVEIEKIGNIANKTNWADPQCGRIYSADGLSPTLDTMGGGQREPKIVEVVEQRADEGIRFFKNENCGTLRTIDSCEDKRVLESTPCSATFGGDHIMNNGLDGCLAARDYKDPKRVIYTLTNGKEYSVAIRKLTPLECWRLMGFDDECFYKAEKVNSNSQLYKQAGNSIVVDVLYNILKNLL